MTKDVEDIIRNKAYFELNSDELERVSEYAQNEEEFGNMKWFLDETKTSFESNKVTAPAHLKKDVMAHLTESKKKKGFWLNSVGVFLLPQEKPLYKKPGFQLGIAAVAVIGFLFMFNNYDDLNENSLAVVQNSDKQVEDKIQKNEDDLIDSKEEIKIETSESEELESPVFEKFPEEREPENELSKSEDLKSESNDQRFFESESKNKLNEVVTDELDINTNPPETMDEEVAVMVEKDNIEPEQVMTRDNQVFENRQDAGEEVNEAQLREKKVDMTFTTNASAPTVVMQDIKVAEYSADDKLKLAKEQILPKSLHINQTKELNQLFFIEK